MAQYYGNAGSGGSWILGTYTNNSGSKKKVDSVTLYLASTNGSCTDGSPMTGDGSSQTIAISIGGVSAGTATISNKTSTNGSYPSNSGCTAYTFYPTSTVEVADDSSVNVYWTNSSDCSTPGTNRTGFVLAVNGNNTSFSVSDPVTNIVITYSANGGKFSTGVTTTTDTVISGNNAVTTITPSRDWYNFASKWNTASDGSGTSYTSGQTANFTSAKTLYAMWSPYTHTVAYNANGGSGAPSSQTKTYGAPLTLRSTTPTRSGYTFLGWSKSSSATTATYSAGGQYGNDQNGGTVTLYAVWKVNEYRWTCYHYKQNVSGSGYTLADTTTGTANYGSTFTPSRKTYTGFTKPDTETITISTSGNTVRYYYTRNKYDVSLTKGTGIASVSGSGSYYYGATVQISCTLSTGYKWKNWTGDASYSNQTASFTMPANVVSLTANGQLKTYTITYNANGGSNPPSNQTKTHFTDLTLTSSKPTAKYYTITYNANGGSVSPATKKVNCTFNNWNTQADGGGTGYNPGDTYSTEASATLYAQWLNVAAGTLATPTYTNAVFVGWYTAISGGDEVTAETEITGNITLYARWRYKVIYKSNGGLDTLPTEYKDYGVSYQLTTAVPEAPSGKTFDKWNTKSDGSGTPYISGQSYTANSPLVLCAIWKTPTYTVTFNPKGGTWADGTTANKSYTVSHGGSVTPPADPSYPGRRFQGWLGSYTNVGSNRTITAMWDRSPIWIMTADGWQKFV